MLNLLDTSPILSAKHARKLRASTSTLLSTSRSLKISFDSPTVVTTTRGRITRRSITLALTERCLNKKAESVSTESSSQLPNTFESKHCFKSDEGDLSYYTQKSVDLLSAACPQLEAVSARSDASRLTSIYLSPPSPKHRRTLAKSRKTVQLHGKTYRIMHPELLDAAFDWMAERHRMFERRHADEPAPWTKDPILARYSFVNVYRVLDRNSQFLVDRVLNRGGSQEHQETCFRVMLFRAFNKIETWERLEDELGSVLSWKRFTWKDYKRVLDDIDESDAAVCSSAYMMISGNRKYVGNHLNLLDTVVTMMKDNLPVKLLKLTCLRDAYNLIRKYRGMGSFLAFQLALDFNMCPTLNWSEDEWAEPGPGAKSCLYKIFEPAVLRTASTDAMLWLRDQQWAHWERIGYTPSLPMAGAPPGVTVVDIEHALCEVDKYSRKMFPKIVSMSNKREIKKVYSGVLEEPRSVTAHIPLGWSARFDGSQRVTMMGRPPAGFKSLEGKNAIIEIMDSDDDVSVNRDNLLDTSSDMMAVDTFEPESEPSDNKSELSDLDGMDHSEDEGDTYEVSHIVAELPDGPNSRQYLVRWVGYGPKDDYWMPEEGLKGCPAVLKAWRAKHPLVPKSSGHEKKAQIRKGRSSLSCKVVLR